MTSQPPCYKDAILYSASSENETIPQVHRTHHTQHPAPHPAQPAHQRHQHYHHHNQGQHEKLQPAHHPDNHHHHHHQQQQHHPNFVNIVLPYSAAVPSLIQPCANPTNEIIPRTPARDCAGEVPLSLPYVDGPAPVLSPILHVEQRPHTSGPSCTMDTPAIIIHSALSTPGEDTSSLVQELSRLQDESDTGSSSSPTTRADVILDQDPVVFSSAPPVPAPPPAASSPADVIHWPRSERGVRQAGAARETRHSVPKSINADKSCCQEMNEQPDVRSHPRTSLPGETDIKTPLRDNVGGSAYPEVQIDSSLGEKDRLIQSKIGDHSGLCNGPKSRLLGSSSCGQAHGGLSPTPCKLSRSYNDLSHTHRQEHPISPPTTSLHVNNESLSDRRKHSEHHSFHGRRHHSQHHHNHHHNHHNTSGPGLRGSSSADYQPCQKTHLLPTSACLVGGRSMRSVSADDVRIRAAHGEYVWKDGKVEVNHGGLRHSESVRYVWKDGHVEKITTGSNNEDAQVEVLETSDGKACSRINPVFVCVFLIGVIAVVIILPVYYAS